MPDGGSRVQRESLVPMIRERLGNLTPSERRLADVIMKSEEVVALSTAGELARMAGVSEATVSRFSNNIGFDRYADMQAVARRAVMQLLHLDVPERLGRSYDGGESFGEILHSVADLDNENLWYTYRGVPRVLEELVEDLVRAERVFCLGARSSEFPAGYLAFALNFLRPGVRVMDGHVGGGVNALIDAEPGDVMVTFSNARYSKDTTTLVRVAAESNLKVYLVADSLACPSSRYTDRVIPVRCESIGTVPSPVAFFSIVNVLVAAVGVFLDHESVSARLARLEDKYYRTDYYHRFPSGDLQYEGCADNLGLGGPGSSAASGDQDERGSL